MKQEVVIKVSSDGRPKSRAKAMKLAVAAPGVVSAAVKGTENCWQIVVTGEGIDSVNLTRLLRKKVGFTELISVKLIDGKTENSSAQAAEPMVWTPYHYQYAHVTQELYPYPPAYYSSCTIL